MKWLGALLLVCAGYAAGSWLSAEEKKRLTALDSLISLFGFMRRRMSESRLPLSEIFKRFEDPFLEQTGFLSALRSGRGSARERWLAAVSLLPTEKEITEELLLFGNELGVLSLAEQEKRLDICASALLRERESRRERLPSRQKSIKTVCLLVGALTAILLL